MVLRKSFYIRWSAGRSPRVHEVNPGRDPSGTLYLETRARSEGYMAKAFKARCPKPSLVGSRRLSVLYTGRWVEFSKL